MTDWQPISTAPKNGESILASWTGEPETEPLVEMIYWNGQQWIIACECDGVSRWQDGYTNWAPRPKAPV